MTDQTKASPPDLTRRIATEQNVEAMVALDTIDLLAARVRKMLSFGRRISMTRRYTYLDEPPNLYVGLTLDTGWGRYGTGVELGRRPGGAWFGVRLKPGILTGFGFSAYADEGNGTEAEAWRRYHAAKASSDNYFERRLDMTLVKLVGGLERNDEPGRDDLIVIRPWNRDGVCEEVVIGFDTEAYLAARRNGERA